MSDQVLNPVEQLNEILSQTENAIRLYRVGEATLADIFNLLGEANVLVTEILSSDWTGAYSYTNNTLRFEVRRSRRR